MTETTTTAISVVVPFYDSQSHIEQCLESLLAQAPIEGCYELILVDNGSKDASRSLVEQSLAQRAQSAQRDSDPAANQLAGVRLLSEGRAGAYCARNTGIRAARGELIAFTDADCRVASDWLRTLQLEMRNPEIGILVGRCHYPAEASLLLRLLARYENSKTRFVVDKCSSQYQFAYANNMAVRARVFEQLGLFKEWRRAADSELVHRMADQNPGSPRLRLGYSPAMQITHLEFLKARARLGRMRLYTDTNSKIETFRELSSWQRLRILLGAVRA